MIIYFFQLQIAMVAVSLTVVTDNQQTDYGGSKIILPRMHQINWLVARFVKLNVDKEIEYSQSALFRRIKKMRNCCAFD